MAESLWLSVKPLSIFCEAPPRALMTARRSLLRNKVVDGKPEAYHRVLRQSRYAVPNLVA